MTARRWIIAFTRKSWRTLPLLCLLGTFGSIWWFSTGAVEPKPEPPNQNAEPAPARKQSGDEFWKTLWNGTIHDPIAFYTATLTVFTGLLAVVSAIQFRYVIRADRTATIAARAAAASADVMKRAGRAYLSFGVAECNVVPTGEAEYIFGFYNHGQTPCILRDIWVVSTNDPLPEIPDYSAAKKESLHLVCAPSGDIDQTGKAAIKNRVPLVTRSLIQFTFFGYFQYEDIFQDVHTTWFAQQVTPRIPPASFLVEVVGGNIYNHYN